MNKCTLIGNLTKDPEMRTTTNGIATCSFTIAVARQFKNKTSGEREADFIPIVTWRGQAENCSKYLKKGSRVAVSGSVQTRSYEAQDKTRRYVTEVVADDVEFLTKAEPQQAPPQQGYEPAADMQEIDDDMPF